jgi:hypothetical protein
MMLALLGVWYSIKRKAGHSIGLPAMIVLVFAAAHVLLEVQSRYHHPVVPFFILTAVTALVYIMGDADKIGNGALRE